MNPFHQFLEFIITTNIVIVHSHSLNKFGGKNGALIIKRIVNPKNFKFLMFLKLSPYKSG